MNMQKGAYPRWNDVCWFRVHRRHTTNRYKSYTQFECHSWCRNHIKRHICMSIDLTIPGVSHLPIFVVIAGCVHDERNVCACLRIAQQTMFGKLPVCRAYVSADSTSRIKIHAPIRILWVCLCVTLWLPFNERLAAAHTPSHFSKRMLWNNEMARIKEFPMQIDVMRRDQQQQQKCRINTRTHIWDGID